MRVRFAVVASSALLCASLIAQQPQQPQQPPAQPPGVPSTPMTAQSRPLRVYIHAGLKNHAEGQHDYPQFLADWSKLLTNRGAVVDGILHFAKEHEMGVVVLHLCFKFDVV
jgi:hypothetical protein